MKGPALALALALSTVAAADPAGKAPPAPPTALQDAKGCDSACQAARLERALRRVQEARRTCEAAKGEADPFTREAEEIAKAGGFKLDEMNRSDHKGVLVDFNTGKISRLDPVKRDPPKVEPPKTERGGVQFNQTNEPGAVGIQIGGTSTKKAQK